MMRAKHLAAPAVALAILAATPAVSGNDYRPQNQAAAVAGGALTVTPPRDWNKRGVRSGKFAESWTLDGEQLNEVVFYAAVPPGSALVREVNKRRKPLPKFGRTTLLVELPEVLENTYRSSRGIGSFERTGATVTRFLDHDGIAFTYAYTDGDELPRRGEAHAAIIGGKLYMATFDAPRLHYFDRTVGDYRALIATARLRTR